MATLAEAQVLRQAHTNLVQRARRDLMVFWATLDLSRPERAREALLEFIPILVDTYGEVGATVAADWYDELRAAASAPGRFRARPGALVGHDVLEANVRHAANHLFTDNPGQALAVLSGTIARQILYPGRGTVVGSTARDPAAAGWQRLARADGCDFCVMLAQRGAVYKRTSVDFASHDDCNCSVAPSWDTSAPEVDVRAYEASRRTTGMSAEQRAQHNALVRDWIARNAEDLDAYRQAAGF